MTKTLNNADVVIKTLHPVVIKTLHPDVVIPKYMTSGASGADVYAYIEEDIIIEPGKVAIIPTGLTFEIPEGYEIQVRPRSGLAAKHGVTVLNSPGTIDSDYRGEVKVILINHSDVDFLVERNMRIAQLVLSSTVRANYIEHENGDLSGTERGDGGFGHTGFNV